MINTKMYKGENVAARVYLNKKLNLKPPSSHNRHKRKGSSLSIWLRPEAAPPPPATSLHYITRRSRGPFLTPAPRGPDMQSPSVLSYRGAWLVMGRAKGVGGGRERERGWRRAAVGGRRANMVGWRKRRQCERWVVM